MPSVKDIYNYLNSIIPFGTQLEWDNSGLLVGDGGKEVKTLAVMLDVTNDNIEKCTGRGVDLIVSHHPVIFKALKNIREESEAYNCVKSHIAVISSHTPWDKAENGVNYILARALGLVDIQPLWIEETGNMVKAGRLPDPLSEGAFCNLVKEKVKIPFVKYIKTGRIIKRVAVCGGSGGSLVNKIAGRADAFVTGDIGYHDFLVAQQMGLTAVEAGHFNTEDISMDYLASFLASEFPNIKVMRLRSKDPISYK